MWRREACREDGARSENGRAIRFAANSARASALLRGKTAAGTPGKTGSVEGQGESSFPVTLSERCDRTPDRTELGTDKTQPLISRRKQYTV